MLLFITMANPLYIQILKNGPFTLMVRVEESTDGDRVITAHYAPKDPSEYTEPEKEKVSLDSGLQLILIESLDNIMYSSFGFDVEPLYLQNTYTPRIHSKDTLLLQKNMDRDYFMTPQEAKELGIIDEVIDERPMDLVTDAVVNEGKDKTST
ncbi:hypothetical protein AgCh_021937 [Apium graveolens]